VGGPIPQPAVREGLGRGDGAEVLIVAWSTKDSERITLRFHGGFSFGCRYGGGCLFRVGHENTRGLQLKAATSREDPNSRKANPGDDFPGASCRLR